MKRIFAILCICLCVIPLFSVPTSAASYDLGTPFELRYTTPSGANESTWPFAYNGYIYDSTSDSLVFRTSSLGERQYFGYFKNLDSYLYDSPYFELGADLDAGGLSRYILVSGYNSKLPTIRYSNTGNLVNSLVFASFVYENLYLPSTGQYLQVSFSVDTALIQAPTAVLDFLNLNTLCFLCDTSGRSGYPDRYSLPKVYPSTSSVKKVGNIFTYTFFFNINYTHLEPLYDSENICLALRIPYYFNSAQSFSGGCTVISNASIPLTYDILTVGGYDQALDDIQNSVDSLKTDLLDFYTDQDSSDVAFISNANTVFDDGKNVVSDYNNANDKIQQVVTGAVIPDMQDIIDEQVGLSGDILNPVKEIFQNTYIVSAFLICFAFCLISVLLYGIRG